MKTILVVAIAILNLTACSSLYNPIPEGYSGPTAKVSDSAIYEDSMKQQFFILESVDGKTINNSIIATRSASYGKGAYLNPRYESRLVQARPMRVKIIATHITGAPIHEIASRALGTFFSVEGEVDFKPLPGGSYTIRGELKKNASSVWIEDDSTKEMATEKITQK